MSITLKDHIHASLLNKLNEMAENTQAQADALKALSLKVSETVTSGANLLEDEGALDAITTTLDEVHMLGADAMMALNTLHMLMEVDGMDITHAQ